jgi:hypothetical protein
MPRSKKEIHRVICKKQKYVSEEYPNYLTKNMKKSKKWSKKEARLKPGGKKAHDPFAEEPFHGDALQGYGSVGEWEKHHGHGFWGNSTTGYITDEEERKRR